MSAPDDPNGRESRLKPIKNPDSAAGRLAQTLRDLVGGESLRKLGERAHCGAATLSDALSGDPRKVPTSTVIEAICKACNADEPTRARLLDMRAEAANSRPPGPPVDPSSPDPAPVDPSSPDPAPVDPSSPDPAPVDPSPPSPPIDPSSPDPARRRKLLVRLLVALVGLVAAGVVGWQLWPHECGGAFSGTRLNNKVDGECIGITDGSYLFNDPNKATNGDDRKIVEGINDVQKRIERENNNVAGPDRYVKVVLLMPLTVSQARPPAISLRQILYSLEGSYIALYRANHSRDFGDPSAVKLQLLLANQGSRQNADPDFINGILKASQRDHPVVAVIGLGSSVPNTKVAVEHLAQQGIPMVSAVTSADSLTNLPLHWSVSPSNIEYANRLKAFLEQQDVLRSGVIVYDRNPDLYTQSLAQAYRDHLGRYIKFPDQPFQGSTLESLAAPNVFLPVVTNLCNAANDHDAPLDMVFYAGRLADFGAFTEALKARTCRQRSLTVLVGATGFATAQDYEETLSSNNVKVIYATSSDSLSWGKNEPGTPAGYPAFLEAYHGRGFVDDADLLDGYAIAHHDALATAAQAIRLAALGRQTQAPNPADVTGQFGHLNLAYAVSAASGTLSFPSEGGRATGRPIPIKQFR
jgi:hypothetical protein